MKSTKDLLMTFLSPTVVLVEDDSAMRESLLYMLKAEGIEAKAYADGVEFLSAFDPEDPGCVVIDLRLPQMTGLQLLDRIRELGGEPPFIIITGHGDVPNAVEAMRQGAVDFIQKPFDRSLFIKRVKEALQKDADTRHIRRHLRDVAARIEMLTRREREILSFVCEGKLTKQIAKTLGISTKTVDVHRSNITKKMGVDSVAQLVRLVGPHFDSNPGGVSST